jgi:hypothetical protein
LKKLVQQKGWKVFTPPNIPLAKTTGADKGAIKDKKSEKQALLEKKSGIVKKGTEAPTPKTKANRTIEEMNVAVINGWACLMVQEEDGDAADLVNHHNWKWIPQFYACKVQTVQAADKVITYLMKKFPKMDRSLVKVLEEMKDRVKSKKGRLLQTGVVNFTDLPNFFRRRHQKVPDKDVLRPYPMVMDGELWICVNSTTHPQAKQRLTAMRGIPGASKFELTQARAVKFSPSKGGILRELKQIKPTFKVQNYEDVLDEIGKIKFVSAKPSKKDDE